MDKKKLNAKDFINIGIFTVIYFVMFFITGMMGYIPIFAVIIPLVLGILGGIPFMLFLTKTGKFGAATIMGTLVSVLCFLMGQSWISIPFGIVFGFLADLIFKAGEYKSWKHTVLGYCVFTEWVIGSMLPMWIMRDGQIKENFSISDFKKKSTDELHTLGLRALQSEDFSKMQGAVCTTKQLYIRDFEASYKNASGGKKKKRKVLDISDLMIPQGSVVGVVGNNGAGKTTFAHNLCGLIQTAQGCMSMGGKTYMANQRIKTCYMVMQDVNHQLFTESVMDEILLSLDNSDEEKAAHEAENIMDSLHISEFRDAHPMSLSGGQKQRVAIASAIASDKQVIVFDEPTSGLDYRHMKKVAENLRELSSLGKTLFIVTHDPELIAECCNYFVFIENGKVLWSDGWNRISRERLQRFFAFEGD